MVLLKLYYRWVAINGNTVATIDFGDNGRTIFPPIPVKKGDTVTWGGEVYWVHFLPLRE